MQQLLTDKFYNTEFIQMIVLHFPLVFVYTHSSDSLKYQSMGDTLYFATSFIAATGVLAAIGLFVQRRIVSYILRYILMHLHIVQCTCILSLSLVIIAIISIGTDSFHICMYLLVLAIYSLLLSNQKKVRSIMIQHYTAF